MSDFTFEAGSVAAKDAVRRERVPRIVADDPSRADRFFDISTLWCGLLLLVLLTLVGFFLLLQSSSSMSETGVWTFLTRADWRTDVQPPRIGVLGMLIGTLLVSLVAIVLAIPLGVGLALYISEYASHKHRKRFIALVDLFAAIPALLFGVWGFLFLSEKLEPTTRWMSDHLSFIPFFRVDEGANFTGSIFIAGIVVSLMTTPIIASVTREVFSRTPPGEKEAALALGGTHWAMIRAVVLPYGRGGIIGASMLGLGRALGETVAVTLLLPQVPGTSGRILQNGGATISGFITNRAGSDAFTVSGLMAAGLVLFIITFATNLIASVLMGRSRSGIGVEV